MRRDIFYEVKYLMHSIMSRSIGIEFCRVPSHFGLYCNEMSGKLAKQRAVRNMSEISYNNLLLSSHETASVLEKMCIKNWKTAKSAVSSRLRYLARVISMFRLNPWNPKYSRIVTCVCKNVLSVNHILLECPVTTGLFQITSMIATM